MTAQDIDRIQNAIRHIKTAVDIDPWAMEIAVKAMEKAWFDGGQRRMTEHNLQPTCNKLATDTISRQDLIDEWKNDFKGYVNALDIPRDDYNGIMAYIDEVPSVQPEQQWISSGKKPPEEGSYLVWMPIAPSERRITVAEYCGGYWNIKTPISAWMPLPEPYIEGEL